MEIFIINIFKKLAALYRHIVNRWHPAVKVVGSNSTHLVQADGFVLNLYLKKPNWELSLKNRIFKLANSPPFACTAS
jgi:hypothetical protein